MLTAKGIGGGSAKVTNGILQEMYAAEGKIPAGTFVETVKTLQSISGSQIKVVNRVSGTIEPSSYKLRFPLEDGRIFYITSNKTAAIEIVSESGEVSVTEYPDIQVLYSNSYHTDDVLDAIEVIPGVIVLFTRIYSSSYICYTLIQIDSENISIRKERTEFPYMDDVKDVVKGTACKISENEICFSFYNQNFSASTSSLHAVIYTINLQENSMALTRTIKIKAYTQYSISSEIRSFPLENSQVFCQFGPSGEPNSFLLNWDGKELSLLTSFNGDVVRNRLNRTTLFARSEYFGKLYILEGDKFSIKALSDKIIPVDDKIYGQWMTGGEVKQCLSIGENLLLVIFSLNEEKYTQGSSTVETKNYRLCAKIMQLTEDNDLINITTQAPEYVKLTDLTSILANISNCNLLDDNRFMLQASYASGTPAGNVILVCSFGNYSYVIQKPTSQINGLTKTKATVTQKGQVWLLRILKAEEKALRSDGAYYLNSDIWIDDSKNVYFCNKTDAVKTTDLLADVWKKTVSSAEYRFCALVDPYFLLFDSSGSVTCLNTSDGSQNWKKLLTNGSSSDFGSRAYGYKEDGNCYFTIARIGSVQVYRVDASSMVLEHTYNYENSGVKIVRAVYKNGHIYTTSASETVNGVDKSYVRKHPADLSSVIWEVERGKGCYALDIDEDGFVYLGSDDAQFTKLDESGTVIVNKKMNSFISGIRYQSQDRIYLSQLSDDASNEDILCLNSEGEKLASYVVDSKIYSTINAHGNSVFFRTYTAKTHRVDFEESTNI